MTEKTNHQARWWQNPQLVTAVVTIVLTTAANQWVPAVVTYLRTPPCAPSQSGLRQAALDGDKDQLSCLLEKGNMEVDQIVDTSGDTALLIAASNCNVAAVRYLLSRGASRIHQNAAHLTAYDAAVNSCGEKKQKLWDHMHMTLRLSAPKNIRAESADPALVPKGTTPD
jgi:ankyrin repeat protein